MTKEELEDEVIKLTIVNKILKLQNEYKDNTILNLEDSLEELSEESLGVGI